MLDDHALKKRYGEKSGNSEVEKLQRKELVRGVARGDETSDRLDRTYKMAGNANNIGDEILLKLQGQREKILSARYACVSSSTFPFCSV